MVVFDGELYVRAADEAARAAAAGEPSPMGGAGPPTAPEIASRYAVSIAFQLVVAVTHAHVKRVILQDMKPENVVVFFHDQSPPVANRASNGFYRCRLRICNGGWGPIKR